MALKQRKGDFVWIVHPRKIKEVKETYPQARFLPDSLLRFLLFWKKPFVLTSVRVGEKKGYIVICPLTARQMLLYRRWAYRKIKQSAFLSKKLGAKLVGLGALTAPLSQGGEKLKKECKELFFTTGNTYTVALAWEDIQQIIQRHFPQTNDLKIAVVGATGSIGSALSKILVQQKYGYLYFLGKTPSHLKELEQSLLNSRPQTSFQVTTDWSVLLSADLIIMATASHTALLRKEHLKRGAVIYNISQPSNILPEIENNPLFKVYPGGLVKTPRVKHKANFLPSSEINFACFAEVLLLAQENVQQHLVGKVKVEDVFWLQKKAQKYNFSSYLFKDS